MISKVFFTMLVIVIVGVLFSKQRGSRTSTKTNGAAQPDSRNSLSTHRMVYGLVAVLLIVSGVVYYFNRSDANRVITLNVLDASGTNTQYQAYQKDIKGRTFITIDDRQVQLAETDRLEIIGQ